MKLQKIVFFLAAEYLKETGEPLTDEPFLTWDYGPVSYSLWTEFRRYSADRIDKLGSSADGTALIIDVNKSDDFSRCFDRVWKATRDRGAIELSQITHARGSAWFKAFQQDSPVLDMHDINEDETYREKLGI